MTTELATRSGLPGRLGEDFYDLPANLPYDRWLEIGEVLQQMERSVQWWLGDWWNYGERHYGEMASQAAKDHVQDATGYTYQTVRRAGYTAERIEPERRRSNLSFSHHAEVAARPPEQQDRLLEQAVEQGWTRYELRDAVRVDREQAQRRAEAMVAGADVESESVVWVPTLDDLTDEMRATVKALAPLGRHRVGWIAGACWILMWRGETWAFRPERWRP